MDIIKNNFFIIAEIIKHREKDFDATLNIYKEEC
jgi:hypothetical protein